MTKLYYQGTEGAYMHQASKAYRSHLTTEVDEMVGLPSFELCWQTLLDAPHPDAAVLVLASENTIAGTIYENLYRFCKYDVEIIGEYNMPIDHCLCSHEGDIDRIHKVYSHYVALPQCYQYLRSRGIVDQVVYHDTAGAAKLIAETHEEGAAAICSTLAAELYGLNILDTKIQDQKNNITRFLAIVRKGSSIRCDISSHKTTIIFEVKDIPSALYRCLGVFAERDLNLTKIESLPNPSVPFSYLFLLDIAGDISDERVGGAIESLGVYTQSIRIIGSY